MTVSCRCESDNWNQHQRARMWTCVKFWTRKSQKPGDLQLSFSGIIANVSARTEKDRVCCSLDVSTLTSSVLFKSDPDRKTEAQRRASPKALTWLRRTGSDHRQSDEDASWEELHLGGREEKKPGSLVNSRNSHVQLRYPRWSHA